MFLQYSIIISAFNVEQYIEDAVDSAVNQDIANDGYEIIIIDDASTDATSKIIDKYQSNNIHVFHLECNQGLSFSRNFGVRSAKGKWVLFLDGDDVMKTNLLSKVNQRISDSNPDFISFGFSKVSEDLRNSIYTFSTSNSVSGVYTAAWNKVYLRSSLQNMMFPEGRYFEDMAFTAIAYLKAKKPVTIPESLMFYRSRSRGITQSSSYKKHIDVIYVLTDLIDYISKNNITSTQKDEVDMMVNKQLFVHSYMAWKLDKRNSLGVLNSIQSFKDSANTGSKYDVSQLRNIKDKAFMLFFKLLSAKHGEDNE